MTENVDADSGLAIEDEDAFLYFGWEIQVMPVDSSVTWESQIALARSIRDALLNHGVRAEVLANFEDEV